MVGGRGRSCKARRCSDADLAYDCRAEADRIAVRDDGGQANPPTARDG